MYYIFVCTASYFNFIISNLMIIIQIIRDCYLRYGKPVDIVKIFKSNKSFYSRIIFDLIFSD